MFIPLGRIMVELSIIHCNIMVVFSFIVKAVRGFVAGR